MKQQANKESPRRYSILSRYYILWLLCTKKVFGARSNSKEKLYTYNSSCVL